MGFKVGDKVRVKSQKEIEKTLNDYHECHGVYFNSRMEHFCEKTIELSESSPYFTGAFMDSKDGWLWVEEWLEPIGSTDKKEKEPVKMEKVVIVRGMNEQQVRKYLNALAKSIETVEMPRSVAAICQEIFDKRKDLYYHHHGNMTIAVDYAGKHIGVARCRPGDKMDLNIGLALSKARAFGWKALEKELLAAL